MTPARAGLDVGNSATLDGLRGFAAMVVVASHASGGGMDWVPGLSLAGIGKYGVFLFFVISAFLLTLQWLQGRPGPGQAGFAIARYAVRRVMRIYPLYAVVLLLGWALQPHGLGVPMDGPAVVRHLALLEGRDIYWSVPVEFKYYLVIPLLAWFLSSSLAPGWKAGGLVLLAALDLMAYPPGDAALNSIVLGDYLPAFLCGSAAAWIVHRRVLGQAPPGWRLLHLADLLVLALLAASVPQLLKGLLGREVPLDILHRQFLAWGVLWSLVLLGVLRGWLPGWAAVLRGSALRRCGRWCFGIYLLHLPALGLCRRLPMPETVRGLAALAIGIAAAALAHALIELPAMRWSARVTRNRAD